MWAWSAPGFNAWGIKSLLKICTANDSLNCISSVCCFMGYVFQSPWKVFCVILILSPEELEGSALLARSMSQSSRVMVLMEDGIFAWGVVNIKAPSDDPAKCLDPGKGQQIAPPCEIPAADAPRPIVSQLSSSLATMGVNDCPSSDATSCCPSLCGSTVTHTNPPQSILSSRALVHANSYDEEPVRGLMPASLSLLMLSQILLNVERKHFNYQHQWFIDKQMTVGGKIGGNWVQVITLASLGSISNPIHSPAPANCPCVLIIIIYPDKWASVKLVTDLP